MYFLAVHKKVVVFNFKLIHLIFNTNPKSTKRKCLVVQAGLHLFTNSTTNYLAPNSIHNHTSPRNRTREDKGRLLFQIGQKENQKVYIGYIMRNYSRNKKKKKQIAIHYMMKPSENSKRYIYLRTLYLGFELGKIGFLNQITLQRKTHRRTFSYWYNDGTLS